MYYLYYLVLRSSSDFCTAYLDYFAALSQTVRTCSTNKTFPAARHPLDLWVPGQEWSMGGRRLNLKPLSRTPPLSLSPTPYAQRIPLLPPALCLLPVLQIAGPDGIPNANINEVASIEVEEIIVYFVVPPQSSYAPLLLSYHQGLGTVHTWYLKDVNSSHPTSSHSKYFLRRSWRRADNTTHQGGSYSKSYFSLSPWSSPTSSCPSLLHFPLFPASSL